MLQLENKTALVTGGSRGIGRAICLSLAKQGAKVIVNFAGNRAAAEETEQAIKNLGAPEPLLLQFDVGNEEAVADAFSSIKAAGLTVDILVNNAGVSKDALLPRFKKEDWDRIININLTGAFLCAKAAARGMMKSRWGRIINISSVVGEQGNAGQVAYCAAKAGILGMTKSMAKELASRQVTVNAVTPGYIETDMTSALPDEVRDQFAAQIPLARVGQAGEVAALVTFLASEEAAYLTGQTLGVNGGLNMR
ncbi:MAG: 3-oxoacyl-[acyl-carrier-protein] reductase [Myxococcales bacterium]|nr:3-oxoacyl-[acyl-carrier-protein] reductase [Myxococcales bacterium]|tara:strand:- start:95 stop:847 length:753 start_codon:yes stop_codon:yes gene_type:complete